MKLTKPDPVTEVLARTRDFDDALKRRDRDELESILAPEFQLAVGGGATDTSRATWLENAVDKSLYDALEFQGRRARAFGEIVVVDAGFGWTVTRKTSDAPAQKHVIKGNVVEVWTNRQGRWQLLWRHSTRVSEEPARAEAN